MAIATRATGEPQPEGGQRLPTVLAECQASRLLQTELERYCDGRIKGRSILLAGYRGAGKTMMVDNALMQVGNRTRTGPAPHMRPLPVTLLGPNLLPNTGPAETDESLRQRLLEAVVLGLHASLSRELVRCLRREAELHPDGLRSAPGELAAQLEIELTEGPAPSRLREFWQRAGALDHGVLFPRRQRAGQGLRELVALAGVGYAYQRVSGELKQSSNDTQSASTQSESSSGWELKGADAIKPLVAVAGGAAIATGAAVAGNESSLWMGLAATLFAGAFFRFTRTVVIKRERKLDQTFLPDTKAATLDRALPNLVQRLKGAGLAPVFVVDELDKVDDLWARITPLLDHFKKLFAEGAFTCLLVNRDFSEALRILQEFEPGGRQFSYFSHRLFANYEAAEMHRYLDELLDLGDG